MNTIVSQVSETNKNKEHTLCDDILRLIGKHVELIRIDTNMNKIMSPILQSIQQIGGWAEWHYNPEYLQNRYSCGYTDEFLIGKSHGSFLHVVAVWEIKTMILVFFGMKLLIIKIHFGWMTYLLQSVLINSGTVLYELNEYS